MGLQLVCRDAPIVTGASEASMLERPLPDFICELRGVYAVADERRLAVRSIGGFGGDP
jgi:hypothetical protein